VGKGMSIQVDTSNIHKTKARPEGRDFKDTEEDFAKYLLLTSIQPSILSGQPAIKHKTKGIQIF